MEDDYCPFTVRKQKLLESAKKKLLLRANLLEESPTPSPVEETKSPETTPKMSLVATAKKLRTAIPREEESTEEVAMEEKKLGEELDRTMATPLISVKERAHGVVYSERMKSSWVMPSKYRKLSKQEVEQLREDWQIDVVGDDVSPPVTSFADMHLPEEILLELHDRNVHVPTQIQMQGLPCALAGRDLIGISFTGSGKTLVFTIPLAVLVLQAELRLPLKNGEGPIGLILCPSRELASQTYNNLDSFCRRLGQTRNLELRTLCLIGGCSMAEHRRELRQEVHAAVATPGRLTHLLNERAMHLRQCRFLAIDEADKFLNETEDCVRSVLDFFTHQRQTLLFSATMPQKFREFAKTALFDPIVVNVGRAGAANIDVQQDVEYVKEESKLTHLLKCLDKTEPPVLVFCDRQTQADDIYEYLLVKNVRAVAVHGGMSQEERSGNIKAFREGQKDVLLGTDVASKGLDFPNIKHVINFDMTKDIETYVHRIGRTGRSGKTGVATTFVNKSCDPTVLMDLRALLLEAGQSVPDFLDAEDARGGFGNDMALQNIGGVKGCSYCGGLGHRITQCPKLGNAKQKHLGEPRDVLQSSSSRYGGTRGYGGDW